MNNELFTMKPNLKQYYGKTVTKEMEFDEYTEDKTVHQVLKDLVLTTTINRENEYNGIKFTETSEMKIDLIEGTILIWDENEGYVVPNMEFYKLDDLRKEIDNIENIYKGE